MSQRPDFTETRIDLEEIFSGDVLKLERHKVLLPDGNQAHREVVRHPGAVAMIPLLDLNTILLERQFRYPLERHILEIPAGKLEVGEEPVLAARRELLEETGYVAGSMDLLASLWTTPGFCDELLHIFVARDLRYEGHPGEDGEFIECVPVKIQDAAEMVRKGEINDAKTAAAIWWLSSGT